MKENIKIERRLYNADGTEIPDDEELAKHAVVLDIGIGKDGKLERGEWNNLPKVMPTNVFKQALDSVIELYNHNIVNIQKELKKTDKIINEMGRPINKHWLYVFIILAVFEAFIILKLLGR